MLNRRTFPLDTTSPYAVKRMAEYLAGRGRLVLFAEGRISRTGCLMKLFDGTGFLLHKVGAKVITCYLRGAHRLPASPNQNAKRWFPRITAHFSDALTPPRLEHMSTTQAREADQLAARPDGAPAAVRDGDGVRPRTLPEAHPSRRGAVSRARNMRT
jgi:acyl-[acyl-carrier-protein]-phospholipid O-acyltransferase/long-chain-fatty-acid--[acyl-carrier-protein] ligase